jgi:hypothetical protein
LGFGLISEGGEQVQNLLLALSAKQVVDGGSYHQHWWSIKPDLPTMPHLS